MVTGLILTPDGKISVGRDRKREIKALINQIRYNEASPLETYRAKGLLAFCHSVEPAFVESLIKKYGVSIVANIKTYENEGYMIESQVYEDRSV
ncbi:hypothetical protein C8024_02125 [Sphingopyxis sp. BSNA05]|uniref:hypothetical protein n=1 Tax=Sphingopyxis sp. BSNA05 TaxID=1236614 RepID=UPI001566326B|nr:hypothetical protein [Sphingopyxis sp. BSNA05]NRD88518.1 hypothetical protein [Sphingopyxis sp. BSNA05]